jgi:hypothetical protein
MPNWWLKTSHQPSIRENTLRVEEFPSQIQNYLGRISEAIQICGWKTAIN